MARVWNKNYFFPYKNRLYYYITSNQNIRISCQSNNENISPQTISPLFLFYISSIKSLAIFSFRCFMICSLQALSTPQALPTSPADTQFYQFQFPFYVFRAKTFYSSNQITYEIIRQAIRLYFFKGKVFQREDSQNSSGFKTVFKCKTHHCNATLIYFKKAGQTQMHPILFNNSHRHLKSMDSEKLKRQQITQFIINLRGEQFEQFRKVSRWVEKFDLSNQEGMYIVEQVYWYNNTEDYILTSLAYDKKAIRRLVQGQETILIFIRSENMKKNYVQYGETITVQFYEQKGKQRSFNKKYLIGYFFAQDSNSKIVLLGIFLLFKYTIPVLKKLFEFFFETTCSQRMPFCILTQHRYELIISLEEIKKQKGYQFYHLIPWYHLIQKFKKTFKSIKNGQIVMGLFCSALQQSNQEVYSHLINQIQNQLSQHPEIFTHILCYSHYYCFRKIPNIFSGFALSTNFGNKVLGQVRNSAVYRAHTGRLFHRLLKVQNDLKLKDRKINKINDGLLKNFPSQIFQLSKMIQDQIMQLIIRAYQDSFQCQKLVENPILFKIVDKNRQTFTCKFIIQYDHWQCQCMHPVKIGLPCAHLIKILYDKQINGSLQYYTNPRWFHQKVRSSQFFKGSFITNRRKIH